MPRRPRWLPLAYPYTAAFVVAAVGLGLRCCLGPSRDWFNVYVPAGRLLTTGRELYPNPFGYCYPPLAALLAVPFANLPALPARLLFYAINLVAAVLLFRGAWLLSGGGRLQGTPSVPRSEHGIALLGLMCGATYAVDSLANHQIDLVLAALLVGGCLLLQRGRALGAGLGFGLAAALKCTPLLWAPYLLWRRRWLAAGAVGVAAVGFNLLPDLLVPPPDGRPRLAAWATQYLSITVQKDIAPGQWLSAINYNHSLAGLCHRLILCAPTWEGRDLHIIQRPNGLGASSLRYLVHGIGATLVLVALLCSWRARRALYRGPIADVDLLEFSLVCLLMLMLSPMSSGPHFATLLLPGLVLARRAVRRRDPVLCGLLAAAIAVTLPCHRDLLGEVAHDWVAWYGCVSWSTLLLFAGCCRALWQVPDCHDALPGLPVSGSVVQSLQAQQAA